MNDMPAEAGPVPPFSACVPQPDEVAMLAVALAAVRSTEGERRWTSIISHLSGWMVAACMAVPVT